MPDAGFARRAVQLNWRNLALGHRTLETPDATFVVQVDHPDIHDANFVHGATAADEAAIDALLARARDVYAHCPTLTFRLDPEAPPRLEARLALTGSERARTLVMVLAHALQGASPAHEVRPVEGDDDWEAIAALKRVDWAEHAPRQGEDPARRDIADGLTATNRLKCPPVRYWMAYASGIPVGFLNSWEGEGGIGQVEDLFVLPAWRRRGIATTLLHRGVAEARARGAGPVAICADVSDTPKAMYAALGWRAVAVCRQYTLPR